MTMTETSAIVAGAIKDRPAGNADDVQGTSARSINLCIGAVALLLGPGLVLLGLVSRSFLPAYEGWVAAPSISEYYYFNEFTRNCFVGALAAIGLLISAYRGWHHSALWDRAIALVSWVAAWLVAFVPCNSSMSYAHFSAAAVLFGLMAAMLWFRFTEQTGDSDETAHPHWKGVRNRVYRLCAAAIVAAMAVKALSSIPVLHFNIKTPWNLTFWVEVVGLSAFSFAWLTKSRFILGYKKEDGWLHCTPAREVRLNTGGYAEQSTTHGTDS